MNGSGRSSPRSCTPIRVSNPPNCASTSAPGWPATKVPRQLAVTDSVGRAENGKLDYPAVRARLAELLEQEPNSGLIKAGLTQ